MTMQGESGLATNQSTDDTSKAAQVAGTATEQASNVAATAADGAKDVAHEATTQVKAVAGEAKQQLDRMMHQTRGELRQQADSRAQQAAGGLRTLTDQVAALAQGRPEEAGPLTGYLQEAQDKFSEWAQRIDQGGAQGVLDDVTRFARRKPGMFLAGAVGAGFLVGRMVRSGAAVQKDQHDQNDQQADIPRYTPSTYTETYTVPTTTGAVGVTTYEATADPVFTGDATPGASSMGSVLDDPTDLPPPTEPRIAP